MTELTKQDLLSLGLDPVTIDRALAYTKIYIDEKGMCHFEGDTQSDPVPVEDLKALLEKLNWTFVKDLDGNIIDFDYFAKTCDTDLFQALGDLYNGKTPQQLFDGYQACHFLIYGKRFPDR